MNDPHSSPRIHLAASILSADFANLSAAVGQAERAGVDSIHVDIMDGRYVHNFTFGIKTIADLRRSTRLPIHVHLEIAEPEPYILDFANAGADLIIVQEDTCGDLARSIALLWAARVQVGLGLSPARPLETLVAWLPQIELLQLLAVEPGFGGHQFQSHVLDKARAACALVQPCERAPLIGIDGGIGVATVRACVDAGATLLAAGSAVFACPGTIAANIAALRAACG